jgi:hypothetical protein
MNNGTYNKNFQLAKNRINTQDNKNKNNINPKIDDLENKVKSPLLYYKKYQPKCKINIKGGYTDEKVKKNNAIEVSNSIKYTMENNFNKKINSVSPSIKHGIRLNTDKIVENISVNKVNYEINNSEIEKKVTSLEKEIKSLKTVTQFLTK